MRLSRFHPSPALFVACVALLVALGGAGYAAIRLPRNSVTTRQVKDFSLLRRDFKRGQVPAGPEGREGPQGPQGPQGIAGPAGPITGDLPAQVTLRGSYAVGHKAQSPGDVAMTGISFGLRLSTPPTPHFIASGAAPPSDCPGTAAAPEAKPGHLCVYEAAGSSRSVSFNDPATDTPNVAARYGINVLVSLNGGGLGTLFYSRGSWAVTAP